VKQRIFIVIGSLVGVLLLVGWFLLLYSPKTEELGKVQKDIERSKGEQVTLQQQLQKLQALKEQEPEIDAQLARVKSLVPDTPDLSTYIREANRVSTEAGIDWVKVAPGEPAADGDLSTVVLTVEIQGGFFNVVDYLTRMEELSRAVTYDTIQISPRNDDSGKQMVNVQLTGRMFSSAGGGTGAASPDAAAAGSGGRPTSPA